MPLLPPRRWFQFQLSTWFVLVAILAWAMTVQPWPIQPESRSASLQRLAARLSSSDPWEVRLAINYLARHPESLGVSNDSRRLSFSLLYPAFALAAIVGWKAAWTLWRRAAGRKAEQV